MDVFQEGVRRLTITDQRREVEGCTHAIAWVQLLDTGERREQVVCLRPNLRTETIQRRLREVPDERLTPQIILA
jgi:hypothetical protein